MGRALALAMVALAALATPAVPVQPSGVMLILPRDHDCPPIALPFGAISPYATEHHPAGPHDGIDFKVSEGTPVLAIAAGKVIALGAGARSAGHYAWLQHAPGDTGLAFWVHSTYRHFDPAPDLAVGAAVTVGQAIGATGRATYPNLHVATLVGGSERHELRGSTLVVPGARLVDPAVVYVRGLGGLADIDRLARSMVGVLVPHATEDGALRPEKSRVIWPLACKRR